MSFPDPMKWFLNLPLWGRLAVGLGIFIPFFTWIVWLNVTHKEKVVWGEKEVPWARPLTAPLAVHAEDFDDATRAAIDLWNDATGCSIFDVAGSPEDADIVVKSTDGSPCGQTFGVPGLLPDHAGGAYIRGDCAEVHVAYPGDVRQQVVVVGHELGHLLGLGDDDVGCQLMRGSVKPVYECDVIYPSDTDRKAVRERYCP